MLLLFVEPDCPEGYSQVSQVSNGRSCQFESKVAKAYDEEICDSEERGFEEKWTPESKREIRHFLAQRR